MKKLNKKGFTLVEILAVIVLLAVITLIAVPSTIGISNSIKKGMLETKIDLILEEAKIYGQDHLSEITNSGKKYDSFNCETITFQNLLDEGYLSSDDDISENGKIINPIDNSDMNSTNIIMYIKNKRVVTILADEDLDGNNEISCS